MEEGMRKIFMFMIMVMMMLLLGRVKSESQNTSHLHMVGGGKYTWAPNVNFSDWATHDRFYVGDWLYFGFDKYRFNVLEVNKSSYDKCVDTNFMNNVTRGGRDVFKLTESKIYYFLSSGGYCFQGMKVAIDVEDISPTPAPAPAKNASPSTSSTRIILLFVLATVLVSVSVL